MCAAIPILRVRSSGNLRSGEFGFAETGFFSIVAVAIKLPAEMRECPVRHSVILSGALRSRRISHQTYRVPNRRLGDATSIGRWSLACARDDTALKIEWSRPVHRYHLKCANALLACAILCVSSRFLIALP